MTKWFFFFGNLVINTTAIFYFPSFFLPWFFPSFFGLRCKIGFPSGNNEEDGKGNCACASWQQQQQQPRPHIVHDFLQQLQVLSRRAHPIFGSFCFLLVCFLLLGGLVIPCMCDPAVLPSASVVQALFLRPLNLVRLLSSKNIVFFLRTEENCMQQLAHAWSIYLIRCDKNRKSYTLH